MRQPLLKNDPQIIITAGHSIIHNKGTGAIGIIDEAIEAEKIAQGIYNWLKKYSPYEVFRDMPTWSLRTVAKNIRTILSSNDILVDIHFNAFHKESARGTEVFIPKKYSDTNLNFGIAMVNTVSEVLGTPKRKGKLAFPGVKTEDESQHPILALLGGLGVGTSILVEIGFVTNPQDVAAYQDNFDLLIEMMSREIVTCYKSINPWPKY
jgi:N-acetylmuramoyl-L-alanine amidase